MKSEVLNLSNKDIKDAQQLWSFVLDTHKFLNSKASISRSSLFKIISETASTDFNKKSKIRSEVILVAKFIANIEPSYKNSDGQYVEFTFLRTQVDFSEDDLEFLCNKIEEIVKPYISVSDETVITGQKLKVKTTMSKKKLIHAAVRHLLHGTEIFKEAKYYHELKARSLFIDNIKVSYAWLVGLAISLQYSSVPAMMEDMCLKFIDQTKNVASKGQVVFYDGAIRTENL